MTRNKNKNKREAYYRQLIREWLRVHYPQVEIECKKISEEKFPFIPRKRRGRKPILPKALRNHDQI